MKRGLPARKAFLSKVSALVAAAVFIVPTSAGAQASNPEPGFGLSPTGCPTFWEVDGRPEGGDIDPPVGPVGTAQLHVTGFGFTVDGDTFTTSIRVADMQRRVGHLGTKSRWTAWFGSLRFGAEYDLGSDSFEFNWSEPEAGRPKRPATGRVFLGPDGGVSISATLTELGIGPHYVAYETFAVGSMFAQVPGVLGGPPPLSVDSRWSDASGPQGVPLVPCPGLALYSTRVDPRPGYGVKVDGVTLPQVAGQAVELQVLEGTEWKPVANGTSEEGGAVAITATLPRGSVTLRGVVTTAAGVGTSAPIELQVP